MAHYSYSEHDYPVYKVDTDHFYQFLKRVKVTGRLLKFAGLVNIRQYLHTIPPHPTPPPW